MPMSLRVDWHPPVQIKRAPHRASGFSCDEIDSLPKTPGVYVFLAETCDIKPIYVGETFSLRGRLDSYLRGKHAISGQFVNIPGDVTFIGGSIYIVEKQRTRHLIRPHESCKLILRAVEFALIKAEIARDHSLLTHSVANWDGQICFSQSSYL